jgi:hypothetical protein
VTSAFIEPESGRVLKVLADGSILILQGWRKPIQICGDTITVPPLTNVSVFPSSEVSAPVPNLPAASEPGQQSHQDCMEVLRHQERRGSSQHVPELPPRAHSAPPTVLRVPDVEGDRDEKLSGSLL